MTEALSRRAKRLVGRRWVTVSTVSFLGLLVACSSRATDKRPDAVGTSSSSLVGGYLDASTPETDVVVRIVGNGVQCTGTFLSPVAVLTAKHCINGDTAALNGSPATPPPYLIQVGPDNRAFVKTYVTNRPAVVLAGPAPAYGPNAAIGVDGAGMDAAIVFLDPAKPCAIVNGGRFCSDSAFPAFDYAHIVRPSLTSPSVGGADTNGGTYGTGYPNGPIGFVGWAPQDGAGEFRLAMLWNSVTLHHYPGYPDDLGNGQSGQFWDKQEDRVGDGDPGDSGGPMFVQRPDGTRDVIGIMSGTRYPSATDCGTNACTVWTDITRGFPAAFIRGVMVDTTRSAAWLQRHQRSDIWLGEVDYTGPCDAGNDIDCDHWYGFHDNCPNTFNPDQRDGDDDGIGDGCTPVITGISPSSGANLGGTPVVISGAAFATTGNTQVLFGTFPATGVSCTSSTQCTAVGPSVGANAFDNWVDVRVIVDNVWSAKVPQDVFTYTTGPTCASSFTCAGVGFGFPNAVATCSTTVNFYENNVESGPPLATGTTFTFPTNDVGIGALACVPNGSCTSINTTESDKNYCGSLPPPPPPPPTCNGVKRPGRTCGAGWHCCGTDGWSCGVCS